MYQNKEQQEYFNKEYYGEFLKIVDKINITPDDPSLLYDHMLHYYRDEEYNESYIDVVGETHCVFNLEYGFFTEKSIKPILSEKFLMVYGSKKIYEDWLKNMPNVIKYSQNSSYEQMKNDFVHLVFHFNGLKYINIQEIPNTIFIDLISNIGI